MTGTSSRSPHLQVGVVHIENLDNALSQYTPAQRPVFLWDTRLSIEEHTLAGVHEMVHAVLHPPGSTHVGVNETPVEEGIAHYVAGRACTHFGVTEYPSSSSAGLTTHSTSKTMSVEGSNYYSPL